MLEPGVRIHSEFLGQQMADIVVSSYRVALAAAPAKRTHELILEQLTQRIPGAERVQLSEDLGMTAQGEIGLDPILKNTHPVLLKRGLIQV